MFDDPCFRPEVTSHVLLEGLPFPTARDRSSAGGFVTRTLRQSDYAFYGKADFSFLAAAVFASKGYRVFTSATLSPLFSKLEPGGELILPQFLFPVLLLVYLHPNPKVLVNASFLHDADFANAVTDWAGPEIKFGD